MNIRKKSGLSLRQFICLGMMGTAALLFSACEDVAETGAPDRWAEDPHEDAENAPPLPGSVGGADPTADQDGQSAQDSGADQQDQDQESTQ